MPNPPDITGVWILQSAYSELVETGERPPQPDRKGVLMLHPDGRMLALLTPAAQSKPATEAEKAAAYRNTLAYSGRYRLEPPDRFVTEVDLSLWPEWLGSEQGRSYRLDGDRLDIVSDPNRGPRFEGATVRGYLSWVRERPQE